MSFTQQTQTHTLLLNHDGSLVKVCVFWVRVTADLQLLQRVDRQTIPGFRELGGQGSKGESNVGI